MIIIGEKINSSIPAVKEAIEKKDSSFIYDLAKKQSQAGANYLDVNAGAFVDDEIEKLAWLLEVVQNASDTPLMIDSPNPKALAKGLSLNKTPRPIVNSISGEKERYKAVLPLLQEYQCRVVALAMDDEGMPQNAQEGLSKASSLIKQLLDDGIAANDIFVDPLIRPIATDDSYGKIALDTIRAIRMDFPKVHITCGLSNISFGLPARKIINQAFLISAMNAGMDSAILNPLDRSLMASIFATTALLSNDEYCMEYIEQYREGNLEI